MQTYETVSGYIHRVSPIKQGKKAAYCSTYLQTTPDDQGMLPLIAFSQPKRNLLKEIRRQQNTCKVI